VEVAEKDGRLRAGHNQDNKDEKQKSKHVVHLMRPERPYIHTHTCIHTFSVERRRLMHCKLAPSSHVANWSVKWCRLTTNVGVSRQPAVCVCTSASHPFTCKLVTSTWWSKKSWHTFKCYNFFNVWSTKKVKTSPWSKFTWEFENNKLIHNSQMCIETKANKPVVIALAYNTSCNHLKQYFSLTIKGPISRNDVKCVPL